MVDIYCKLTKRDACISRHIQDWSWFCLSSCLSISWLLHDVVNESTVCSCCPAKFLYVINLVSRVSWPLQLYSEYIANFDHALKTLDELQKKSSLFAQVLREFESEPRCNNLPVAGYLLETVQRIPRYKLLMAGKTPFRAIILLIK